MALVSLIPGQTYSTGKFLDAVRADPSEFQHGAVLEIITERQLINKEDQQQKVTFVFRSWCVQRLPNSSRPVGLSGARLRGEGLISDPSEIGFREPADHLDCCWFSIEQNLFPGDIQAKTITYIHKNFIANLLEDMPEKIPELIRQYLYGDGARLKRKRKKIDSDN